MLLLGPDEGLPAAHMEDISWYLYSSSFSGNPADGFLSSIIGTSMSRFLGFFVSSTSQDFTIVALSFKGNVLVFNAFSLYFCAL